MSTFFKNTEIILYSFRYFRNSGSVRKRYFQNTKSRRQKSFQNIFFGIHYFYFQIYKSRIHKTCFGKDVLKIFWKEQFGSDFIKGTKQSFQKVRGAGRNL